MRLENYRDRADVVTPIGSKSASGWFAKAVGFIVARLSLTDPAGWGHENSNAGESVTARSVLGLSAGWACVNLIAGTLGTLPFEVWRTNPRTGFPERADGHWLSPVLKRPNAEQTRIDMMEGIATALELRGNAYIRKGNVVSGGRVVSLTPIPPDDVYVSRNYRTNAIEYRVRDWQGRVELLGADEIWHVRGFGGDPLGGLSTLTYGKEVFGMAQALDKAAASTFRNGLQPSGVMSFTDFLTEPRKKDAKEQVERLKGAGSRGEPLILEGGASWHQLSFSPEEAQMLASRGMSVEEVARYFGVPPIMIGHSEKNSSWGTGVQEVTLAWVKYGLRRRFKRIEESADQQILTAQDRVDGYFLRFNLEALLRADSKGRAEFYKIMTAAGLMTINECRRLEGLPPVPGGDVPRMQSQNIPIGAAMQALPVPSDDGD